MSWQLLVLIHTVFSALQALQYRAIARDKKARHAALAVNAIMFSVLYICALVVLPAIGGVSMTEALEHWIELTAASMTFVLAMYFMYKSLTHLESATATVLGTSSALFTLMMAHVFFSEKLSPTQLIGIALLLPCIWYVLSLAKRRRKFIDFKDANWVHGFLFVLGSSFCLALGHVLEKDLLSQVSLGSYLAFGWLLQAAVAWVFYLLAGQHAKKVFTQQKTIRSAMQLGVIRAAAGLFFIWALIQSNNVTLVTVVANFRIILVAVLAGWILGEREYYYKKLAAAAVAVMALSIIFYN